MEEINNIEYSFKDGGLVVNKRFLYIVSFELFTKIIGKIEIREIDKINELIDFIKLNEQPL